MPGSDNWWDQASDYFNNSDFNDPYYSPADRAELFGYFSEMLREVEMGNRPTDTLGWYYMQEEFGFEDNDFDWDDFREWYDSQ